MKLTLSDSARLVPVAQGVSRVEGFFPDSIVALQTTREGGASIGEFDSFNLGDHVGDDPVAVAANRARLMGVCTELGAKTSGPVWLTQVHGTRVLAGDLEPDSDCRADARISSSAGEICAVMTADCLPILIARPEVGQVAAVHAGWRGLCEGVVEATLEAMLQQVQPNGGSADEWLIWLGPAIGPDSFEVGQEVREAFLRRNPAAKEGFHPSPDRPHKWLADLAALAIQRITSWPKDLPVRLAREKDCVMKNVAQYFSYRRCSKNGGPGGRMASLIYRAPV